MTSITLYRHGGHLQRIVASGHAGYGTHGTDIVCSAVSALMQCLLVGLDDVAGVSPSVIWNREKETMDISWNPGEEAVGLLTESIGLSLKNIALTYGEYISIKEVQQ
ncbi:MAG: ribosomal-processing cysteine protease Prp [Synergistales bacterium]|nr:ribosomal-processing cysteine protease Prp [Synergistales bacterium]